MATFGAVIGQLEAELGIDTSPPAPPDPLVELQHPPAPSQAGAQVAWEGVRSFFSATAPWQHSVYSAITAGYGGL
jgi:hypothetical protein